MTSFRLPRAAPLRKVAAVKKSNSSFVERLGVPSDFLLVLVLFAAYRLLSLALLRPGGFFADFSDFYYYREYGALSDRGLYPYVNIWSPYPPIFPWLLVGIHRLTMLLPPWEQPQLFFNLALGSVLVLAECGNLALVYCLAGGRSAHGKALRSALFYALLFAPAFTAQAHFDNLPVFWLLLGLWALVAGRWTLAGAATGVGVMTKLVPLLLAPVALRRAWPAWTHLRQRSHWRPLVRYLLALALTVLAIAAPFLYLNPRLLLAPVDAQRIRPPWQTLWAILDGYYGFGVVPADVRDLAALDGPAWPSRVPALLPLLAFAVVYGLGYLRAQKKGRRSAIAFMAFGLVSLFLFNKGWSPQYLVWLLPFVAILWPNWQGASFALSLTFLNYLESHVYFMLLPQEHWLLMFTASARTVVLLLLAIVMAVDLSREQEDRPTVAGTWRRRLALALAVATVATIPVLGWRLLDAYVRTRYQSEPARPAIEHLRRKAAAGAIVYFSRQQDLEHFYPHLHQRLRLRTLDDRAPDGDLAGYLDRQLAKGWPCEIWLVQARAEPPQLVDGADSVAEAARRSLGGLAFLAEDISLDAYRLSCWLPRWAMELPDAPLVFDDAVELLGWTLLDSIPEGQRDLRLKLVWRLRRPLRQPLSAFVHLSDGQGPPLAQSDGPPAWPWPTDRAVVDERILATAPSPGDYELLVGLYDPDSGARLKLPDGRDAFSLGRITLGPGT